eukprot:gene641-208_t
MLINGCKILKLAVAAPVSIWCITVQGDVGDADPKHSSTDILPDSSNNENNASQQISTEQNVDSTANIEQKSEVDSNLIDTDENAVGGKIIDGTVDGDDGSQNEDGQVVEPITDELKENHSTKTPDNNTEEVVNVDTRVDECANENQNTEVAIDEAVVENENNNSNTNIDKSADVLPSESSDGLVRDESDGTNESVSHENAVKEESKSKEEVDENNQTTALPIENIVVAENETDSNPIAEVNRRASNFIDESFMSKFSQAREYYGSAVFRKLTGLFAVAFGGLGIYFGYCQLLDAEPITMGLLEWDYAETERLFLNPEIITPCIDAYEAVCVPQYCYAAFFFACGLFLICHGFLQMLNKLATPYNQVHPDPATVDDGPRSLASFNSLNASRKKFLKDIKPGQQHFWPKSVMVMGCDMFSQISRGFLVPGSYAVTDPWYTVAQTILIAAHLDVFMIMFYFQSVIGVCMTNWIFDFAYLLLRLSTNGSLAMRATGFEDFLTLAVTFVFCVLEVRSVSKFARQDFQVPMIDITKRKESAFWRGLGTVGSSLVTTAFGIVVSYIAAVTYSWRFQFLGLFFIILYPTRYQGSYEQCPTGSAYTDWISQQAHPLWQDLNHEEGFFCNIWKYNFFLDPACSCVHLDVDLRQYDPLGNCITVNGQPCDEILFADYCSDDHKQAGTAPEGPHACAQCRSDRSTGTSSDGEECRDDNDMFHHLTSWYCFQLKDFVAAGTGTCRDFMSTEMGIPSGGLDFYENLCPVSCGLCQPVRRNMPVCVAKGNSCLVKSGCLSETNQDFCLDWGPNCVPDPIGGGCEDFSDRCIDEPDVNSCWHWGPNCVPEGDSCIVQSATDQCRCTTVKFDEGPMESQDDQIDGITGPNTNASTTKVLFENSHKRWFDELSAIVVVVRTGEVGDEVSTNAVVDFTTLKKLENLYALAFGFSHLDSGIWTDFGLHTVSVNPTLSKDMINSFQKLEHFQCRRCDQLDAEDLFVTKEMSPRLSTLSLYGVETCPGPKLDQSQIDDYSCVTAINTQTCPGTDADVFVMFLDHIRRAKSTECIEEICSGHGLIEVFQSLDQNQDGLVNTAEWSQVNQYWSITDVVMEVVLTECFVEHVREIVPWDPQLIEKGMMNVLKSAVVAPALTAARHVSLESHVQFRSPWSPGCIGERNDVPIYKEPKPKHLHSNRLERCRVTGHSFLHLENTKIVPVKSDRSRITERSHSSSNFAASVASNEIQPVESENSPSPTLTVDEYRFETLTGDSIDNVVGEQNNENRVVGEQNINENRNRNPRASCRRASKFINTQSVDKLQEVVAEGKRLRHRMVIATTGLGGLMTVACFTVSHFIYSNDLASDTWGRPSLYYSQATLWAFFMLFGIIPNDLILIRGVAVFIMLFALLFGALVLWGVMNKWFTQRFEMVENNDEIHFNQCGVGLPLFSCVFWAVDDLFTVIFNLRFAWQAFGNLSTVKGETIYDKNRIKGMRINDNAFKRNSREALDFTWQIGREYCLIFGVKAFITGVVAHLMEDRAPYFTNADFLDKMIYSVIKVGMYFIYTPMRRYRIVAFFTSMVVKDETKKAASVAALLGNVNAENSLQLAREKFRTICFSELRESDFAKNKEDSSSTNRLYSLTSRTILGECDVFLSHSWHDNGKTKFKALKNWCEKFETKYGRHPRLWLDKACIDQNEIASDLLCLPLFLAGCETLLIIAGPTYTERLWCVMEIFVFLQMGGSIHRVTVIAIEVEDEHEAMSSFEVADINKCKCYLDSDRNKLLSIVQQGFGSFDKFNEAIRQVFQERMFKERISLDEKINALAKHTANQNRIMNAKMDKLIKEQAETHAVMVANQERQARLIEQLTNEVIELKYLVRNQ